MPFKTIYHHLPTALVFLTVAGVSWIWGGLTGRPLVQAMPWVLALALEVLLFLPQRRPYEDMATARGRLWYLLVQDPLFYVVVAFLVLLVIPFFNKGLCPVCDALAIAAGKSPRPPIAFFPYCVNLLDQAHILTWFVPAFVAMLAVKYALTREGKRVFVEMIVWNGAALAVFGFIEHATGASFVYWEKLEHPVYFFSTFGYPNAAGAFFTMIFAFSIGLWRYRAKETDVRKAEEAGRRQVGPRNYWLQAHYPLVASILLIFAVLYTRSRAAILLTGILATLAGVYVVLESLKRRVSRVRRLRTIIFSAVGLFVIGVMICVFAPKDISEEMATADLVAIADRVTGKAEWHTTAAWEIFKEHPFFGTGGWGFKHYSLPYVPQSVRKGFGQWYSMGGANVHNDYLQFLCEHGAIGAALLLAIVVLLLWPIFALWGRLFKTARFLRADAAPPKPLAIFSLPAGTFWVLAGNVCLMVHAFGDCPLRGAAVITVCLSSLAAAEGFMPREQTLEKEKPEDTFKFHPSDDLRISHHHHHHHHSDK